MKVTGETEKRGTEVHFLPDETIFTNIDFHYEVLAKRLRERSIEVSARQGWVRFSPHFYTSDDELEHCVAQMAEIVEYIGDGMKQYVKRLALSQPQASL